jgi:hypothetical protein
MNDNCKDCGKCCLETEMPLSNNDINLIIENSFNNLTQEDFTVKNNEDYFQLKNIDGNCFFLDPNSKICKIYANRPRGCRFYPLIFDYDRDKCVLDDECPRTSLFYRTKLELKDTCSKIKTFLSDELGILFKHP